MIAAFPRLRSRGSEVRFALSPPAKPGQRVGVRGCGFGQRDDDGFHYVVGSLQRIVVPDAQYAKPQRFERMRAFRVTRVLIEMLAAIEFDDQTMLDADEIHDITVDGMLATKLRAELAGAQARPESLFDVGWRLAHDFCTFHVNFCLPLRRRYRIGGATPPHPTRCQAGFSPSNPRPSRQRSGPQPRVSRWLASRVVSPPKRAWGTGLYDLPLPPRLFRGATGLG